MSREPGSTDIERHIEDLLDGNLGEEGAALLWKSIESNPEWGDRLFEEHRNDFPLRLLAHLDRNHLDSNVPLPAFSLRPFAPSSPANRDYVEAARLLAELAAIPVAPNQKANAATIPEKPEKKQPSKLIAARRGAAKRIPNGPLIPLPFLILLILVLLIPLIYNEWKPHFTDKHPDILPRPNMPAVVTGMSELRWTGKGEEPAVGEVLFPGSVCFESGTLELLFQNGVRTVVEGPADLLLVDDSQVFCRQGRCSVSVPRQGAGFEIQTQNMTIRDIGTRFFAAIDKEQAEVHVLKGIVELEHPQLEKRSLKTGEAVVHRQGKAFASTLFSTARFIDRDEMRRRFDAFLDRNGNWRSPKRATEVNKAAVGDVAFESGASSGTTMRDATTHGGMGIAGRTDESRAFRFDDRRSRIRVKPLGTFPAFTAAVWLRVDRLNGELNPILMSEGSGRGGIVWHISPRGSLLIGLRRKAARGTETVETPVVFAEEQLGRWIHLALCLDDMKNRIAVYVDGDPVYSASVAAFPPLNLNAVDIGNWRPQAGKQDNVRNLDGAVEHAIIFNRALTLPEIRNIYICERVNE